MGAYADSPWIEIGSISFNPASPPTVNWALGACPTTVGTAGDEGVIGRTGAGDYSIGLSTAVDTTEFDMKVQMNGAVAASGLQSAGVAHTSDTVKRVTMLQEAALGATSALTDYASATVIRFFKRVIKV